MNRPVVGSLVVMLVATLAATPMIQSQTVLPTRLVQAADLVHDGSFTLPDVTDAAGAPGFHYAQGVLAFDPAHDSLFIVGHDWHQHIAEVSVPGPGGVASVRQAFRDGLEGRMGQINPGDANSKKIGGMYVLGDRLVIAAYSFYDGAASARASHFVRSTDLAVASVRGPFRVGSINPAFFAGYFAPVPTAWQSALGGTLLNGQCCLSVISRTSYGPSVSTVNPTDLLAGRNPTPATVLIAYPEGHQTLADWGSTGPLFNGTTSIRGVAMPEGSASVLFFGRQGMGAFCYGEATTCHDPQDSSKGTHAYPYESRVWAYRAADLMAVRAGKRRPWDVKPYLTWRLDALSSSGVGGVAIDILRNRIFISQPYGDGEKLRIHIFHVNQPESS